MWTALGARAVRAVCPTAGAPSCSRPTRPPGPPRHFERLLDEVSLLVAARTVYAAEGAGGRVRTSETEGPSTHPPWPVVEPFVERTAVN
jgi:hypothetical protein